MYEFVRRTLRNQQTVNAQMCDFFSNGYLSYQLKRNSSYYLLIHELRELWFLKKSKKVQSGCCVVVIASYLIRWPI